MSLRSAARIWTNKTPQPFEDKAVVVAGAGEDGVDLVAVAAFEEVAPQPAIALEMSDHGLDGGAPLSSFLIVGVMPRFWPDLKTRCLLG